MFVVDIETFLVNGVNVPYCAGFLVVKLGWYQRMAVQERVTVHIIHNQKKWVSGRNQDHNMDMKPKPNPLLKNTHVSKIWIYLLRKGGYSTWDVGFKCIYTADT